jgi:hypothetical protein
MRKLSFSVALLGSMLILIAAFGAPALAYTDSAQVPSDRLVWSCWYWPYNDEPYLDPNLYDLYEAMYRYDQYDSGAQSRSWEYQNHGPPQHQPDWAGHCHAWSGASCWEAQPTTSRTLNGIEFRVRDRKGLITEVYFNCANGNNYEIYVNGPTPGLFWRWLRREIGGVNSMHGHAMGFIGELYYGDEIWNYPIYYYSIDYSGYPISGTMTIHVASDGSPSYADSTTLYYKTYTYQFSGVQLDSSNEPVSSGTWIGTGSSSRPDAIWRPYYADTWTKYLANYHLDATHLANIFNPVSAESHIEGILKLLLLD